MTLKLEDQYRLAMHEEAFRNRVTAALRTSAVAAYTKTALVDTTKQASRIRLAASIMNQDDYATTRMAWMLVSQSSLTNETTDLTDTFLLTQVDTLFDQLSQEIFPNG